MDRNNLLRILSADSSPIEKAIWLRNVFFEEIRNRFNSSDSRKRLALYQGEQIPNNERNLTDVRTRMGILIEFEIARISNMILVENNIQNLFWSYVVANRFPDLEVRDADGNKYLRLEIKCLQCIAEEKSANFDTLIKDISPFTDYVIVCLWDWNSAEHNGINWDNAPWIHKIYVLHAYSLAKLRDTYWLNNPPPNIGNGYQGYDIRYAITYADERYSKEQGNYGKLTRIWKSDFQYRPQMDEILHDTENEYIRFSSEIITIGFEILAQRHFNQLHTEFEEIIQTIHEQRTRVGFRNEHIAYVLKMSHRHIMSFIRENQIFIIINMAGNYRSSIYKIQDGDIIRIANNLKPKLILQTINAILHHDGN